jgi:hypothetical protein
VKTSPPRRGLLDCPPAETPAHGKCGWGPHSLLHPETDDASALSHISGLCVFLIRENMFFPNVFGSHDVRRSGEITVMTTYFHLEVQVIRKIWEDKI